jgi:hypothetical protein
MLLYRCYLLDESDRIRNFVEIQALTDTEATSQARMQLASRCNVFELWCRDRFVCREAT